MKFRVTFKTSDAVDDAICRAAQSDAETEQERETLIDEAREVSRKYFKYGEYVTVEVDTQLDTCTVITHE